MKNRLPLVFILTTVAIDSIGIGIIIPVMPDLILDVGAGTIANAAVWGGILASVFAIMQMICGPTVGNLSDRFGRRPVLLISLAFMAVDYLIMGIAHTIWLLLLGRIIGGITASTQATAAAFVADISEPDEKAQNFGLVGAAFGIGFVLGPLFGAIFAEFGTRAPFYAAAVFSFANFVLGYFVLPETVTDEIRRPFQWKRANPLGALYNVSKLPGLKVMLISFFLLMVAFNVYPSVWAYFTVERFAWEPRMIGISLAAYGITMALVQGWLIRYFLRYLSERQTAIVGMVFEVFGFLAYGFITAGWMVFALIPLGALGAVVTPAMQGIMSRTAFDNQQGELQGVFTSIMSLSMIVGPMLMTTIFYAFVQKGGGLYLPGAPFLLSMFLTIGCLALFVFRTKETGSSHTAAT